mmetsp:Transcript_106593/g.270700  ORF Transcript_106593/g.270700 Transcript_106593/m.270700 type:complete len:246 (-) Transcript_106593:117-854(-)
MTTRGTHRRLLLLRERDLRRPSRRSRSLSRSRPLLPPPRSSRPLSSPPSPPPAPPPAAPPACLLRSRSRAALCLSSLPPAALPPPTTLGRDGSLPPVRALAEAAPEARAAAPGVAEPFFFFLRPKSSNSSPSLSHCTLSFGSWRSNSPPPRPSSAARCFLSSSINLAMSSEGFLHWMQLNAPASFLILQISHSHGPCWNFSPSRQSSSGLAPPSGLRAPHEMQVMRFLKFTVRQLGFGHCQSFGS